MNYQNNSVTEFEYEFVQSSLCEEYHCHNCIEIIYVKSGKIRLRTDMSQSVCDLSDSDYAVIACSDVHRCFCLEKCEYELFRFPVSYQNMFDGSFIRSSFVIPGEVLRENRVVYDTLFHIMQLLKQNTHNRSVERSLCSALCSVLMSYFDNRRKMENNSEESSNTDSEIPGKQSISFETIKKFDLALNYIRENYTKNKINLETLSAVSGLNKTFLSALFPKLTGRNFKDYLDHLRIDYAIELITTSEKSISEIAFLCGFETIRTLNNVFKSVAGVTPSAIKSGFFKSKESGINTQIMAVGSKLFDYKWTCTVELDKKIDENSFFLFSSNTNKKQWCHLMLRMLFFAGREYTVSYKAKTLDGTEYPFRINCNFCFPDDVTKIEHHAPVLLNKTLTDDGWVEYTYKYTVPDYYKPSSLDNFSVYSSPFNDRAVSFYVKDIVVETVY